MVQCSIWYTIQTHQLQDSHTHQDYYNHYMCLSHVISCDVTVTTLHIILLVLSRGHIREESVLLSYSLSKMSTLPCTLVKFWISYKC